MNAYFQDVGSNQEHGEWSNPPKLSTSESNCDSAVMNVIPAGY